MAENVQQTDDSISLSFGDYAIEILSWYLYGCTREEAPKPQDLVS